MVRETGLEPVRDYHTPLKRARLPIPPLSHIGRSLERKRHYSKGNRHCQAFFLNFFKNLILAYYLIFSTTNYSLSNRMQSAKCKAQSVGTALRIKITLLSRFATAPPSRGAKTPTNSNL